MFTLPDRKLWELLTIVVISETHRQMGWKDLDHLVGKLLSMNLVVPRAVDRLFRIQRGLTQGRGSWGMAVPILSSEYCGLVGAHTTGGVQAHTSGQYFPLQTHPSRELQCVRPWGRETHLDWFTTWSSSTLGHLTSSQI